MLIIAWKLGKRPTPRRNQLRIKMNQEIKQALKLAKKLGVKVWDNNTVKSASWSHGMQIEVNMKKQKGAYPILHELGHVFMGYGCCREHDEYVAHGFAFGLAKAFNIKIPKKVMKDIDVYAGRSSHKACGAIENRKVKDSKSICTEKF